MRRAHSQVRDRRDAHGCGRGDQHGRVRQKREPIRTRIAAPRLQGPSPQAARHNAERSPVRATAAGGRDVRPLFTMRCALDDPMLLGDCLPGDTWFVWRAFLVACMGEALTDEERAVYSYFTQRAEPPTRPVRQAAFIIGRRGGKDQAVSVLASYLAGCCEWPMLVRGETGVVMIIAADTEQADEQLGRIEAA